MLLRNDEIVAEVSRERSTHCQLAFETGHWAAQETQRRIVEWLVERRRELQERKEQQSHLKPKDIQSVRLAGIKARALQEVISYLNK